MVAYGKLYKAEEQLTEPDSNSFRYTSQFRPLAERLMERVKMLGNHYVSLSSRMLIKMDSDKLVDKEPLFKFNDYS